MSAMIGKVNAAPQVSVYAMGNSNEGMAETFAALSHPDFDLGKITDVKARAISSYSAMIRRACAAADLPALSPHELRHSAASVMFALGTGLKEVSSVLGHADVSVTADIYVHLLQAQVDQATHDLGRAVLGE